MADASFSARRSWRPLFGIGLLALAGCAQGLPPRPAVALPTNMAATSTERLFGATMMTRFERPGPAPLVGYAIRLDLAGHGIRFATTAGDTSKGGEFTAALTSEALARAGAQLAVNASYFLPFRGGKKGGEDYYPHVGDSVSASGAVVAQRRTVSPVETTIDVRVDGILCMRGAWLRILGGQRCPRTATDAVAAGPLLLLHRKASDFAEHDPEYAATPAPRTALGVSADHRTAWIVVIDGRQPGYSVGASLDELAAIFSALGASDAINLDGGGSTTLVGRDTNGKPRILNRPIHTGIPGRERPVANQLFIFDARQGGGTLR